MEEEKSELDYLREIEANTSNNASYSDSTTDEVKKLNAKVDKLISLIEKMLAG